MMKMKIEIDKRILKILYDTFCIYRNSTKKEEIPVDCDKCILRDIKWIFHTEIREKEFIRDLCFAIYHEYILEEKCQI